MDLEEQLSAIVDESGAGEVDGFEFGEGEVVIYSYGPDASRLFSILESRLRAFPLRPAVVVLRFGEASDSQAREETVEL
ncbi:hypothetical protein ACIBG8_06345 [Nonomuraea sp. NPDC050556]|uniref:hypothetical protein n=1 Tax=Nonomuraea sp. NPDC050556 TaxID=3364369 RepID=UPI00378CE6C4